jgi:hypothetical protein
VKRKRKDPLEYRTGFPVSTVLSALEESPLVPFHTFRLRILVFCWPGSGTRPKKYPLFSLLPKVRFLVFDLPGALENRKARTWPGIVSAVLSLT